MTRSLMNREKIIELQQEFGLSYHIEYASLAQQLVGFEGKRVLEVGGSLPKRLVIEELGTASWTALEEMDYWRETLSTGHVLGTPPVLTGNPIHLVNASPKDLQAYNVLHGRIEDLPVQMESQFDCIFSIAAFEHIARLPLAFEKIKRALVPGGKLFAMFAPIWSSYNGHHLPEIVDTSGKHWNFGDSPIPPWGHLLFRPMELFDLLSQKCDVDTAREIVYFVYASPHINRLFLDDYFDIVERSGLNVLNSTPIFEIEVPDKVNDHLLTRYPGRTNFGHNGLLLVLERGQ